MPRTRPRLARAGTALALAAGVALAALLLERAGIGRVSALLLAAWWGLLCAIIIHVVQIVLTGAAWRAVTPGHGGPGLILFALVRWLREGVNRLLPVLPVAGVAATLRVLSRHGLPPARAAAGALADSGVEVATQIPFTVLGIALLAAVRGGGAVAGWMLGGLLALCALTAVIFPARRLGFARLAERGAARLGWPAALHGLDGALRDIWNRPSRAALAGCLHLAAWMLGAAEIWVVLLALGRPVAGAAAVTIESLAQAVRVAAIIVPGAAGLQEGGYILLCGQFGIPADASLAVSLIARLRDVALGVPSLAVWLALERRGAAPSPAAPVPAAASVPPR